ncbi:hypothetical protein BDN72DRAFT_775744, partial [Pluteus cervinus]
PMSSTAKASRAQQARRTLNHVVPSVLKASTRARDGVASAKLLQQLAPNLAQPTADAPRQTVINVVAHDTLQTAYKLMTHSQGARIAILSKASELRPGGGFLSGASSQEESLCMRTTLYPSLRDEFYRLPEKGCVYTPDVCVFRGTYTPESSGDLTTDMTVKSPSEWWFIDVISCAAIRSPDLDDTGAQYADAAQCDLTYDKVKQILRAAAMHGCRYLVLGAFGCGAFSNPPQQVAKIFRRALLGKDHRKPGEFAGYFDEIVFAIKGGKSESIKAFQDAFMGHDNPT